MAAQPSGYLSYLLRLWREDDTRHSCWRASLESPATGERTSFVDLESLCAFLRAKIDLDRAPSAAKGDPQRSGNQSAGDM